MSDKYRTARLDEIPAPVAPEPGAYEWKPIRHHLGIRAFGINAMVAHRAGEQVVDEHTEAEEGCGRHEELYLVTQGHARFKIDGSEVDAPAGTLVFVPDPQALRGATALQDGTTVVAIGGEVGAAFKPSPWEEGSGLTFQLFVDRAADRHQV